MTGLNEAEALAYIRRVIDRKPLADWGGRAEEIVGAAFALDLKYMRDNGVLDAEGAGGDAFYDDDEAFEFIVEGLVARFGLSDEQGARVGLLVEAYLEAQEAYMNQAGLLHWE